MVVWLACKILSRMYGVMGNLPSFDDAFDFLHPCNTFFTKNDSDGSFTFSNLCTKASADMMEVIVPGA